MKNSHMFFLLALSFGASAAPIEKFVTIDNQVFSSIENDLNFQAEVISRGSRASVLKLNFNQIEEVSHKIHAKLHRCGGFITYNSLSEAREEITSKAKAISHTPIPFFSYDLKSQDLVLPQLDQISEEKIRSMVITLSGFETRHYESESGVKSSEFIFEAWSKLIAHRSDAKVELFKHDQWSQPSVILTIQGSENGEEIVILGGHADSIAMDGNIAPGADDNASGISSITEVLRVLIENDYRPKRTIKFMAYAAEEVGLLGSREIAKQHQEERQKVVGVLQLDMTLFKGSEEKDIVLISDYTNRSQNEFLGKLIDEYVKVPWGFSRCGYGCSDHASWSQMGYPASFPFESTMENHNVNIHTINDTLESAGGNADHSVKFAKLGLAYLIEMSN
jgi:leucyl aminopeptidase